MKTEESIFAEATELPVSQRAAFIRNQCGNDSQLRQRVENLVAAHEQQDSFLDGIDPYETTNPTRITPSELKVEVGRDIGSYRLLQKLGEGGLPKFLMRSILAIRVRRKTFCRWYTTNFAGWPLRN
jgi:serine/threonine-protein kinase